MSVFLVPSDTPGFTIGRFHNKFGRRLLPNAELVFQNARIPARYLIGKEGEAWGSEGEGGAARRRTGAKAPALRRRSACSAPPSTWAPSGPATKRRSTTAGSASRAASRSSSSSTWPSTWPA